MIEASKNEWSIGVEVGGTFTDWVVTRGGSIVRIGKVLSTPAEPDIGVMNAIAEAGIPLDQLATVIHGSTVATNVVLERKGAVTALITTEGFRDVLAIQRQAKQRLFDLFYKHPEPLVKRDRIFEVAEKIGPDGAVRRPLALGNLIEELRPIIERDRVESLAVCLLHSYANPDHERQVEAAVSAAFPDLHISISSDVVAQFREYERSSTIAMSAYVKPIVYRYLSHLEERLAKGGFTGHLHIIQANGGSLPASGVRRHAIKMVLSGPAAGVVGATEVSASVGLRNIITFDMGGTSTDVCLVNDAQPKVTTDYKIAGLPLNLPMIDIATVGAGGGSIAGIDAGGILRVGPESAGSTPGPACYGRGGRSLTVTDANVILGYIRPSTFFGGRLQLDSAASRAALSELAPKLGLSPMAAAEGVRRLVNFNMARAMRLVSIERGYDPRDYTVVAYGGGGPLHAAQLAEELGCKQVLVPMNPGVLSAYGLVIADSLQDFLITRILPASEATPELLSKSFAELEGRAVKEFADYGHDWASLEKQYALDMRYMGQAYELTVPVDRIMSGAERADQLASLFHEIHRQRYGHASSKEGVEIVNFRLTVLHRTHKGRSAADTDVREAVAVERAPLWLDGREQQCDFIQGASLPVHSHVPGPAVIEDKTSTTFIPLGWRAEVLPGGHLLLQRTAAE